MSMRVPVLGLATTGCGLLLAILPGLPWYSADLPTGSAQLSGYGATGGTWILPVAGVVLAVAGLLTIWWRPRTGTRLARIIGAFIVLAAGVAVGWAARAALVPAVGVVAERPGMPASPLGGDWIITVLPAAWITIAAAALAGMAGILLLTARPKDMIGAEDVS